MATFSPPPGTTNTNILFVRCASSSHRAHRIALRASAKSTQFIYLGAKSVRVRESAANDGLRMRIANKQCRDSRVALARSHVRARH